MHRNYIPSLILVAALQPALAETDSASSEDIRNAWLAFSHARGEAALIRGDVDHPTANDTFRVIPDPGADALEEKRLQLGFELFNEKRLSRDGSVACNSCHIGLLGGVDRQPVSFGVDNARGTLNAPTIFNAALNFRQFWDGRSLSLQEQALQPIENPAEFDHDLDSALTVLRSIPDYVQSFNTLYPDGITANNLANAIAYYETMNFTGISSPFLRMIEGEQNELSRRARRGQRRFVQLGCASCHNGINLGGNSYQQLGVAVDWYIGDRVASEADQGLYGRTGRERDRHVFKVPTLHSVANTGPWFHDGSVTSLQQAVDQMARHQSGRYLENNDIDDIVAFLRSMGDSVGMIGDCAVGGNYGVSLDCDVKRRTSEPNQETELSSLELPAPEVLDSQHSAAYAAALQRTAEAPQRILAEIQRIRTGEVAHYDFLQYEHIEMLRHARALSFPPATISKERQEILMNQAMQWQQTAAQYELKIADFLRSHAVSLNAKLNYLDLLRTFSLGADEDMRGLLAHAETSVRKYYAQPDEVNRSQLESATLALDGLDLNHDRLGELQQQLQMLVSTAPSLRNIQQL